MAIPTISKANTSISTAERKRIPMCGGCEVISPLPLLNWPGIRPSTVAETFDLQSWLIRLRGGFPQSLLCRECHCWHTLLSVLSPVTSVVSQ